MIRQLLIFNLLIFVIYLNAQEEAKLSDFKADSKKTYVRASFVAPSIGVETKLSSRFSLNIRVGAGYTYVKKGINNSGTNTRYEIFHNIPVSIVDSKSYGFTTKLNNNSCFFQSYTDSVLINSNSLKSAIHPYFAIEFRDYYNFDERPLKGRHIRNNSGEYFGLLIRCFDDKIFQFAPVWGLQRNVNKFYFNFETGFGCVIYKSNVNLTMIFDFSLGFLLN